MKTALDSLSEEARKAIETLGLDNEQGIPIASLILQEVGTAGLCAWVAYQEVLESGSVDAFDMGPILAAALPTFERTIRSQIRERLAVATKELEDAAATDQERSLVSFASSLVLAALDAVDEEATS